MRVARFVPAAGASVVVALVVAARPLEGAARALAIGCAVAAWLAALVFTRREVRLHASVVAAIAAVTAAGQTEGGVLYGVLAAVFLLTCIASMRAARSAERAGTPRVVVEPRAGATILVVAAAVSAALITGLPIAAVRVERRFNAFFGVDGDGPEATAFSTTMQLGSTRGMLQSDAIVLRIDGPVPEYLRGAVYDRYDRHYWTVSSAGRQRNVIPTAPLSTAPTRITLVRGAPNGEDMRWFLPAAACDLATAEGRVEIDGFGVTRRARGKDPQAIGFRTSCASGAAPIAPPGVNDLDVPKDLLATLQPLAAQWTADARTDREKLDALRAALASFEYSLAVTRDPRLDPIVDFLTVHRAGHCELFASAMVMLARTQGVSARVVGGYRVSETNPLTGRAVVRDRNAHAWVEAWVDGAWRGWDPTPTSDGPAPRPSTFEHLTDAFASWMERVTSALADISLLGATAVLAGVVAFWFVVQRIGAWLRARLVKRPLVASAPPLPCFIALEEALAEAGHERGAAEPIETFARRLLRLDAPWAGGAAEALLSYAELRYGGRGESTAVVRDVTRASEAVRARSPKR